MADIRRAANRAGERVRRVSGYRPDEDLVLYRKLQPPHFVALAEKFGMDKTLEYIEAMERRIGASNGYIRP